MLVVARGTLYEKPQHHLHREQARQTLDLFDSNSTLLSEIYRSKQQI